MVDDILYKWISTICVQTLPIDLDKNIVGGLYY